MALPAQPTQSFFPSIKKSRDMIYFVAKKDTKISKKGGELPAYSQEYRVNTLVNYKLQACISKDVDLTEKEKSLYMPGSEQALLDSIGAGPGFLKGEWVETHVERRIQLFFLKLIVCYQTPFIFSATKAEDQIGGGCTVALKSAEGSVKHKTQAAHSSTFPCLYAQSLEKGAKKFVYLKHSHLYNQSNATVELPIYVNQTDTFIDESQGLREEALKIINRAARGKISPQKGIQKFVSTLAKVITKAQEKLPKADLRQLVLKMYLNVALEMQENLSKEDPDIFDYLLGINVQNDTKASRLRDVVFAKRFKLIQKTQSIETEIARKVLDAQNKMLKKRHKSLKSLDPRLRYVLLESASSANRRCLEKLFCTSLEQLQADFKKIGESLREGEKKAAEKKARITSFRDQHQEEVEILNRDLRNLFMDMNREELLYRSQVFRGLRKSVHDWTQQYFSDKYRRAYPSDSMSRSMVSRFEGYCAPVNTTKQYRTPDSQRKKVIDMQRAERIASTFEVDLGIFLPSLVSSNY